MAISRVSPVLLSEWFGFSLGVLMVACLVISVRDDRPPSGFEQTIVYVSLAIVTGWFLVSGWSVWCAKSGTPR